MNYSRITPKMNTTQKQFFPRRAASKGSFYRHPIALGLAVAVLGSGNLRAQVTLDPAWRVTPDTTKPGFKWNYFQNNDSNNKANNNARTEADLAGQVTDSTGALLENLGDPTVVGAAIGPAAPANPTNGLLYFEISNVINLSKVDGDTRGHSTPTSGYTAHLEPGFSGTACAEAHAA